MGLDFLSVGTENFFLWDQSQARTTLAAAALGQANSTTPQIVLPLWKQKYQKTAKILHFIEDFAASARQDQ